MGRAERGGDPFPLHRPPIYTYRHAKRETERNEREKRQTDRQRQRVTETDRQKERQRLAANLSSAVDRDIER